jgi:prepilin-type N-terminal cleavage/methylation domain-containing protein
MSTNSKKGFTLIELLVVIAIIGLLSSVVLAALNTARAKGRDAVRQTELTQIQTAVELYATDHNNTYPLGCQGAAWSGANASVFGNCPTNYITGLTPTYIGSLPLDPLGSTGVSPVGYGYIYFSNGTDYKIMSYQSSETKSIPRCPAQCPNTGNAAYCAESGDLVAYSPGGACF